MRNQAPIILDIFTYLINLCVCYQFPIATLPPAGALFSPLGLRHPTSRLLSLLTPPWVSSLPLWQPESLHEQPPTCSNSNTPYQQLYPSTPLWTPPLFVPSNSSQTELFQKERKKGNINFVHFLRSFCWCYF